jgi:hypothetical protein
MLGLLTALMPELAKAQTPASAAAPDEDLPHSSYGFWNGFFDSVNTSSPDYNVKARGPADQLADPGAQTQYLHYSSDKKRLRYATDIQREELLDHEGDVAVSIALAQYRPGTKEADLKASQLRVDTTQIHPMMNIVAPLAWSAIASVVPSKSGKVSLDSLGFRSVQATQGTSKILLTKGSGKVAVNISRAAAASPFLKVLNVMMQGAKVAAPIVCLPAVSVPALSTFTEALSYWEERTRFIMSGNLTTAVATKQAMDEPDREANYIGLTNGEYLMVPQRHVDELHKELPNLDLVQGYLIAKDADPNLPLAERAESAVPGITYASMRVSVQPLEASMSKPSASAASSSDSDSDSSCSSKKSTTKTTTKSK